MGLVICERWLSEKGKSCIVFDCFVSSGPLCVVIGIYCRIVRIMNKIVMGDDLRQKDDGHG